MLSLQCDGLILEDVPIMGEMVFRRPVFHVVLRAGDPPDATLIQIAEVVEIHISLVKYDDFARLDRRADLAGALVVMLTGGVDNGKRWQEAVQVEPQVHFGGGLAPAVSGPIDAVGDQLDDRGIHCVNPDFEAPQQTLALAPRCKIGTGMLEVIKHRPEELFGELRIAFLVGV